MIAAGAGNDTVTYRGTETSIDGGSGSDTLVLATSGGMTSINFVVAAGSDQTVGDTVSVANFENIDASALSTALSVAGIRGREYHHDRIGQRHHRWRWRRGHHQWRRRQRHRRLLWRRNFNRRRRRHQHADPARGHYGQSRQCRSDVGRYGRGFEFPERRRVVARDRRFADGIVGGQRPHRRRGQRYDRRRRRSGYHHGGRRRRHRHLSAAPRRRSTAAAASIPW